MDLLDDYEESDAPPPTAPAPGPASARPSSSSSASARPVSGDWPSLVFLAVPPLESTRRLATACAHCDAFRAFAVRPLGVEAGSAGAADDPVDARTLPLHLSLSRAFPLRQHQIDAYIAALGAALRPLRPFMLRLAAEPCVLINETRSRSFFALKLHGGPGGSSDAAVRALLEAVDGVQAAYGRPPYYRPALPHVSVAILEGDAASSAADGAGLDVVEAAVEAADAFGEVAAGLGSVDAVEAVLLAASAPKRARSAVPTPVATGTVPHVDSPPLSLAEVEAELAASPPEWRVGDVCLKVGHRLFRLRLGGEPQLRMSLANEPVY